MLAAAEPVPDTSNVCPIDGKATLPETSQPDDVAAGQSRVVRVAVSKSLFWTPVGVRVAHCVLRFEKSGDTGVGVPVRVKPPTIPEPVAVAAADGP